MMRIAVLFLLFFASYAFAQRPAKAGWYSDYAAAKAEAKRSGKPMFVTFRCEA